MNFKCEVLGKVRFGNELEDILTLKGVKDINSFLYPNENSLESPYLFKNIEKARDILIKHISCNNTIDLLVDCDVDGYTSAAIIYQYIKQIKPDIKIRCYIHTAKQHGLAEYLTAMCNDNSKLVIVPDAGTGDIEETKCLKNHNKDIIILDHHNISDLGNKGIVINNQLSDKVNDKSMTGVGIVYKFLKVLDDYFNVNIADDYIDLVALGMIADRADLFNLQTRYLILKGLKSIENKTNVNKLLKLLISENSYVLNNKVTINGIAFYICPLLNSIIRLGNLDDKFKLFKSLCNEDSTILYKNKNLNLENYILKLAQSLNRKQRKLIDNTSEKLIKDIEKYKLDSFSIIVCNAKDVVDESFTGLIANKISSIYQRPCLLMRKKGDICKGSGRGNDRSNILDFNKWCVNTGLFEKVSGHQSAFGCEISYKNTNELMKIISKMERINVPIYYVYNEYNSEQIHAEIIKNIAKYNYIWGNNVTEPLFFIKCVPCSIHNIKIKGSKQNILEFTYHNIKFIKFNKTSIISLYNEIINLCENIEFDIVCKFDIDYKFNNTATVIIEDLMFKKSNNVQRFGF